MGKSDFSLTYYLNRPTCLSWSFALTWCCTLG